MSEILILKRLIRRQEDMYRINNVITKILIPHTCINKI